MTKKPRIAFFEKEVGAGVEMAKERGVRFQEIFFDNLEEAMRAVAENRAEALVGGISCPTRDVILAARDIVGMKDATFSGSFVMRRDDEVYVLGDCAACKHPNEAQLVDIILQTFETAKKIVDEPRAAVLSFSTLGSGGKDDSIDVIRSAIKKVQKIEPDMMIDGEMQLDAAIDKRVAQKKMAKSKVAGQANVLILPDLNSGNILYKAMERFGGFSAAGPILQGFERPIADLSRGATAEDVALTFETILKLV